MSTMYAAITIIKNLLQVLLSQIALSINATMYNSFPPFGINETMYYLKKQMCYLERTAELIKVSTSINHQSATTYP